MATFKKRPGKKHIYMQCLVFVMLGRPKEIENDTQFVELTILDKTVAVRLYIVV